MREPGRPSFACMARVGDEDGQASVELVAAVPVLLLVTLVVAQLAVAGYALWSAGAAARAGARAGYVGGDARAAARSSLPSALRAGASVDDSNGLSVRVEAPALVPGIPSVPVTAKADLGTGDGS
jgi:Flp pilus assembly protein TadG